MVWHGTGLRAKTPGQANGEQQIKFACLHPLTLWGWAYRFEAYTPAAKRVRGYYAMPLLWRDRVIGWGNLSVTHGQLNAELGYVDDQATANSGFSKALDCELEAMARFLGAPLGNVNERRNQRL
jgi:uncharacterized protein YcaQ